jgi:hypothetical protein
MLARVTLYVEEACAVVNRLLVDARVVEVPRAYTPTFVMLSSVKPFFFHRLKNDVCCSDNAGASDPGIQEERQHDAEPPQVADAVIEAEWPTP